MQKILRVIALIAMLNFFAFLYGDLIIGGDAINGKIDGGKFFVGDHGKYTEVTEGVYRYSRFHTLSLFVTHPLGMVAGLISLWRKDPSITNNNKRLNYIFFGIAVAIMFGGVVIGLPNLSLWLFPLVMITYMLLSLRDANRQKARGDRTSDPH